MVIKWFIFSSTAAITIWTSFCLFLDHNSNEKHTRDSWATNGLKFAWASCESIIVTNFSFYFVVFVIRIDKVLDVDWWAFFLIRFHAFSMFVFSMKGCSIKKLSPFQVNNELNEVSSFLFRALHRLNWRRIETRSQDAVKKAFFLRTLEEHEEEIFVAILILHLFFGVRAMFTHCALKVSTAFLCFDSKLASDVLSRKTEGKELKQSFRHLRLSCNIKFQLTSTPKE